MSSYIKKNRHFVSRQHSDKNSSTPIYPYISYGICAWGQSGKNELKKAVYTSETSESPNIFYKQTVSMLYHILYNLAFYFKTVCFFNKLLFSLKLGNGQK